MTDAFEMETKMSDKTYNPVLVEKLLKTVRAKYPDAPVELANSLVQDVDDFIRQDALERYDKHQRDSRPTRMLFLFFLTFLMLTLTVVSVFAQSIKVHDRIVFGTGTGIMFIFFVSLFVSVLYEKKPEKRDKKSGN